MQSVFCCCIAAASGQQASTAVARLGREGLSTNKSAQELTQRDRKTVPHPTPPGHRMHITDPAVHVRVWWITDTQKDPACTYRTGYSTALAAAVVLPRKGDPNFPARD